MSKVTVPSVGSKDMSFKETLFFSKACYMYV